MVQLAVPKHIADSLQREKKERNIKKLANKDCKDCWGKGKRVVNGRKETCMCVIKAAALRIQRAQDKEMSSKIITPKKKVYTPYDK